MEEFTPDYDASTAHLPVETGTPGNPEETPGDLMSRKQEQGATSRTSSSDTGSSSSLSTTTNQDQTMGGTSHQPGNQANQEKVKELKSSFLWGNHPGNFQTLLDSRGLQAFDFPGKDMKSSKEYSELNAPTLNYWTKVHGPVLTKLLKIIPGDDVGNYIACIHEALRARKSWPQLFLTGLGMAGYAVERELLSVYECKLGIKFAGQPRMFKIALRKELPKISKELENLGVYSQLAMMGKELFEDEVTQEIWEGVAPAYIQESIEQCLKEQITLQEGLNKAQEEALMAPHRETRSRTSPQDIRMIAEQQHSTQENPKEVIQVDEEDDLGIPLSSGRTATRTASGERVNARSSAQEEANKRQMVNNRGGKIKRASPPRDEPGVEEDDEEPVSAPSSSSEIRHFTKRTPESEAAKEAKSVRLRAANLDEAIRNLQKEKALLAQRGTITPFISVISPIRVPMMDEDTLSLPRQNLPGLATSMDIAKPTDISNFTGNQVIDAPGTQTRAVNPPGKQEVKEEEVSVKDILKALLSETMNRKTQDSPKKEEKVRLPDRLIKPIETFDPARTKDMEQWLSRFESTALLAGATQDTWGLLLSQNVVDQYRDQIQTWHKENKEWDSVKTKFQTRFELPDDDITLEIEINKIRQEDKEDVLVFVERFHALWVRYAKALFNRRKSVLDDYQKVKRCQDKLNKSLRLKGVEKFMEPMDWQAFIRLCAKLQLQDGLERRINGIKPTKESKTDKELKEIQAFLGFRGGRPSGPNPGQYNFKQRTNHPPFKNVAEQLEQGAGAGTAPPPSSSSSHARPPTARPQAPTPPQAPKGGGKRPYPPGPTHTPGPYQFRSVPRVREISKEELWDYDNKGGITYNTKEEREKHNACRKCGRVGHWKGECPFYQELIKKRTVTKNVNDTTGKKLHLIAVKAEKEGEAYLSQRAARLAGACDNIRAEHGGYHTSYRHPRGGAEEVEEGEEEDPWTGYDEEAEA